MLRCFTLKSTTATEPNPTSSPPSLQENSRGDTPRTSGQPSPTVNLTREYTLTLQTNSYNEIWSKIQIHHHDQVDHEVEHAQEEEEDVSAQLVAQLLHPNQASVDGALRRARPNKLTRIVSAYFDNSEGTSRLCLRLHRSVERARSIYAPVHDLLDLLPLNPDSFNQSQYDWAFNVFLQFDSPNNPFPHPDSDNFHDMRRCLSQFKLQLDFHLHKSRRRVRLRRRVTTGSGPASAVATAAHAVVALLAAPLIALLPTNFTKKEFNHIALLDAAARGTYVLNNHLDTIDCLVVRLHAAVESDKLLVRLCLGRDRYLIQEVVKQLRKNQPNFLHQLKDLEEHVCLCFAIINRARSQLLQEIHLHQMRSYKMENEKKSSLMSDMGAWAMNVISSVGIIMANKQFMSPNGYAFSFRFISDLSSQDGRLTMIFWLFNLLSNLWFCFGLKSISCSCLSAASILSFSFNFAFN